MQHAQGRVCTWLVFVPVCEGERGAVVPDVVHASTCIAMGTQAYPPEAAPLGQLHSEMGLLVAAETCRESVFDGLHQHLEIVIVEGINRIRSVLSLTCLRCAAGNSLNPSLCRTLWRLTSSWPSPPSSSSRSRTPPSPETHHTGDATQLKPELMRSEMFGVCQTSGHPYTVGFTEGAG